MDVAKMLAELRQEREQIEEAILSLERLARGRGKRRGRPPAWMQEVKKRGRPPGSKNKPKVQEGKGSLAKVSAMGD
jgi:DNA invertase Pin-like site-specific DNA recombinase